MTPRVALRCAPEPVVRHVQPARREPEVPPERSCGFLAPPARADDHHSLACSTLIRPHGGVVRVLGLDPPPSRASAVRARLGYLPASCA